jgi:glyoxylase-like metal-dependent hydrolase (beta-lactamase superfamily II)
MSDYFEIDFLDVESKKSGDAIPLRYCIDDITRIHVTDGGFQSTGDKIVEHVNKHYDNPCTIDAVIVSHSDRDHAGGLCKVLETYDVTELWMLRPWLYAEELIDRFKRFTNVDNLASRLK